MGHPTALVTGATSGIGLSVARGLLDRGYFVLMTGRNGEALDKEKSRARSQGRSIETLACDLSRQKDVETLIEVTRAAFQDKVDILVNNAGIATFASIEETSPEEFDHIISVNLRAPYLLSRAILPLMKSQKDGLIVNISSVAGIDAWSGSSLYSMTKFALRGLTGSLLAEGAPFGVKAVAICPGYVATPLVAGAPVSHEEMIQPEDILKTILYLTDLSPAAVTGDIVMKRLGGL
ncbi:MAG: SDR family NAD(P)-dependent oxidoreductase [Nitrospiraceae bacterium]|jgi:3-oxoacyl-[acyl-carrier protein] reductase|nr:SDR family NAD(P)-dependent oxidoreductase [Nitrospiraceae bacterium]